MSARGKEYSSCLARHWVLKATGSEATCLHASATAPTSTSVPYMSKTTPLIRNLEDGDRLTRLRAYRIVWIDARVADEAVRIDDEPARNREPPGVVAVESLKVYSILAVQ